MERVLIVADDLTGAAEMAAFAATPDRPTRVAWPPSGAGGSESRDLPETWEIAVTAKTVIDTESRNLAAGDAHARLATMLGHLPPDRLRGLVYKKIDSTLRGPIRAEISLLHDVAGLGPVIAAPAYPRMGRTTRAGVQYVGDVAVADGPAGDDPLAATRESDVTRLLPQGECVVLDPPASREAHDLARELAHHRSTGRHVVVDAESEADLERLAEALRALPSGLVMGTGGLARHLWPTTGLVGASVASGRIIVINGSHHPAAKAQAALLLSALESRCEDTPPARSLEGPFDDVHILTTPARRVEPGVALRDLERAFEEVIALGRPRAVIVTGGETALNVLKRLRTKALDVTGELIDGVPLGIIAGGPWHGTILATKAGGFGSPDVLLRAVRRLRVSASTPA